MKRKIINILFSIILLLLTILIFINQDITTNYFLDCFYFLIKVIIPSIFPFMIFVNFIVFSNCIDYLAILFTPIGKIFKLSGYGTICVIASLLGGYPYSAIIVSSFIKSQKISTHEGNRIINSCFFPSLSFLFVGLLNIDYKFIYIIISLYVSSFIILFISSLKTIPNDNYTNEIHINNDISNIYNEVMNSSIKSIINICFTVLFFNLLTSLLTLFINNERIIYYISGILEFSNSSINILLLDNKTFIDYLILMIIISFSSLSIIMQSMFYLKQINIKIKQLLISRLIIVLISVIIFTLLYFI